MYIMYIDRVCARGVADDSSNKHFVLCQHVVSSKTRNDAREMTKCYRRSILSNLSLEDQFLSTSKIYGLLVATPLDFL